MKWRASAWQYQGSTAVARHPDRKFQQWTNRSLIIEFLTLHSIVRFDLN
jgi:hypothetical protein